MIDANIILDVLAERKPYFEQSAAIWKLCEANALEGYVFVLTFANLVYVLRKQLDPANRDVLMCP